MANRKSFFKPNDDTQLNVPYSKKKIYFICVVADPAEYQRTHEFNCKICTKCGSDPFLSQSVFGDITTECLRQICNVLLIVVKRYVHSARVLLKIFNYRASKSINKFLRLFVVKKFTAEKRMNARTRNPNAFIRFITKK